MNTVSLSVRITAEESRELQRLGRRRGLSKGTLGAAFVSEGLREARFPAVEFRNIPDGRMAYVRGTRLAVWQLARTVEECGSPEKAASLLDLPPLLVESARLYALAYPDEMRAEIDACLSLEEIRRTIPGYTEIKA